jgi:hypothetical protein
MLLLLNAVQLVLYIALLALVGQAVLFLLAGARRQTNVFYGLLQVLSKPFTRVVRKIMPRRISERYLPALTFVVLAMVYLAVTFERVDLCVTSLRVGQTGCQ